MNKIRVFEAFSGYGSQSIALRNIGVDYEVVAISEIDKYAIQTYESIHGKTLNLGDISKIDIKDIPNHDLFTYSFPCQDISVIGKREGIIKDKTRSGLLYECEKIIEHCRPKYLLMENVKNLVGKKFKPQFDEWLEYLEGLGYTNYWKVLNAKDYGVPQNRERVFCISILNNEKEFEFPEPKPLNKLTDYINTDVYDEEYNLNPRLISQIKNMKFKKDRYVKETKEIINGEIDEFKIMDYRYDEGLRIRKNNLCPTLTTRGKSSISGVPIINYKGIQRFITPTECFKLMGLNDDDINKIKSTGINDTQQCKLAGNSIVVNVLEEIFKKLFY